jgi:capsular polysaccharide biosynthesis protein
MRANRLVSPASGALNRFVGNGLVPTGVVDSLEEAAATSGGRCVTARTPETITRPPFLGRPADLRPLEPATDTEIGRIAVAELPGGRVLHRSRALITGRNDLVWELSHYFGAHHPREHPVFADPFPPPAVDVPGRLGVLATRADATYYHFLVDALPRIGVLEQAGDLEPVDRWYVPAGASFQRQILDLAGIGVDQRVDADEVLHVRAESLVAPGLASVVKEKNPPWMVAWLRNRLMGDVAPPGSSRPLYVTRKAGKNNRAVVDEDAVIRFLEARGFDVIDAGELSVVEQIRVFAGASVIVAPHGAALANLVFASPGTGVVEIFPPGCVLPDYWRLSDSAGLRYRYLSQWPAHHRRLNRQIGLVTDIEVDLAGLESLLDELQA